MRLYKVHVVSEADGSFGFAFYSRKSDAERHQRDEDNEQVACVVEAIEVVPTKAGILDALNRHAGHPDNG